MAFQQAWRRLYTCAAALVLVLGYSRATAQEVPKPKVDVALTYSWLHPSVTINNVALQDNNIGGAAAITFNITRHFGLSFDGAVHTADNNESGTLMAGPRLIWRGQRFQPFLHGLGGVRVLGINGLGGRNLGPGFRVGGGLDIALGRHVSLRLLQGDYVWSRHDYSALLSELDVPSAEARAGLVFKLGGGEAQPRAAMSATCSAAQPESVLAGEPVSVVMSVVNIPPKHTVTYSWTTTGGEVESKEEAATINTAGLVPGTYTVTGTATDKKARKGERPATCTAQFTVNEPAKHPPTLACSITPTTLRAGEPAKITCSAQSPDNRPVTYSYTASAGRIAGTGATVALDTTGAPPGQISVMATATDDRGLSATARAVANVEAAPAPAAPQASKLNEITFSDPRSPARVDNVAKAILDDVALRLQREPDAKAVIIGYSDTGEPNALRMAQQRAVNTKAYLVQEKGLDRNRIEVRTGAAGGKRADIYLVPSGATFNAEGTQAIDEARVSPQPRTPRRVYRRRTTTPR